MSDLEQAFKIIEQNKDKQCISGPKDESRLLKAEHLLNIKFSPSYRRFLKNYGCGGLNALEIYGIAKHSSENFDEGCAPDGVWLTLNERMKGYILPHFIHIANTGDGFYYYLDSSQVNEEGEYPVVIWTSGMPENKKEKVAEDFGEFLLQQVQQALVEDED